LLAIVLRPFQARGVVVSRRDIAAVGNADQAIIRRDDPILRAGQWPRPTMTRLPENTACMGLRLCLEQR